MKRATTLERMWRQVEAGFPLAEIAAGAPAGLAAELEMARALHALGASIEAPAASGEWTRFVDALPTVSTVRHIHQRTPMRPARAALAIAASFAILVTASLHAGPASPLYGLRRDAEAVAIALSPNDAGLRLRLASARLDDLLNTLSTEAYGQAPAAADSLASARTSAVLAGADVSMLDAKIRIEVPAALVGAPPTVAEAVDGALSGVLSPSDAGGGGMGGGDHPMGRPGGHGAPTDLPGNGGPAADGSGGAPGGDWSGGSGSSSGTDQGGSSGSGTGAAGNQGSDGQGSDGQGSDGQGSGGGTHNAQS